MKKFIFMLILCANNAFSAEKLPQTIERKAQLCATCHNANGISTNPAWPNIAGQHVAYLLKQMNDYKRGRLRNDLVMTGVLANLSSQDMKELADYFSNMPRAEGTTPKQYVKRGELLYRGGDLEKHITACIACHGPKGTGNGQAGFPLLAGQKAQYTISELNEFKEGARKNDLNHIMRDIAGAMSEKDIKAVAYYVQGLH